MVLLFRDMKPPSSPPPLPRLRPWSEPLRERVAGMKVGVLVCGSNIDFDSFERYIRQAEAAATA